MAQVGGADGSFSYNTSGNDPQTAEVEEWQASFSRVTRNTTPVGWTMERIYMGRLRVQGTLRLSANNTEMAPLPNGLTAVMSLTSYSGKVYTFRAALHQMDYAFSSPRDLQAHQYTFVGTADNSSDAIEDDHA